MANGDNLKGHGFHERTAAEQRAIAIKGGRASGEARRRKADFRKTLNALLTTEIDNPDWTPLLKEMGLESTLESAVNMAMIKRAMQGDVKAFVAIRDTIGQTTKTNQDLKEQEVRAELLKAQVDKVNKDAKQNTREELNNPFAGLTTEQLLKLAGEKYG